MTTQKKQPTKGVPANIQDANLPVEQYVVSKQFKGELKKALPKGKNVEKFARGVRTAVLTDPTGKLLQCDPVSIVMAVLTSAQLDLEVDAKGHAYLIPYGSRCQLIPGYKGYLRKIQECGIVDTITTQIVYEGDEFQVEGGTNPGIKHIINTEDATGRDNGMLTYVYAIIRYKSGAVDFEVMSRGECEKIRDGLKFESNVWKNHFSEMARKTVVRRFVKRLQLPTVENILQIDDLHSQGMIANIDEGQVVAVKNDEVKTPDNEDRNLEIEQILHAWVADKKNKLDNKMIQSYIDGLTGKQNYNDLTTAEAEEVFAQIKKDYKL
jgi:recombination protein RecT